MTLKVDQNGNNTPHLYFVDESGDGVIFDSKGRVLVGSGKVQDYFILGMVECRNLEKLTEDLSSLRAELLADPYFKGVPSMQPEANKTASFFHAKDDLPEVRREVFRVLQGIDFTFYAVVRTMSAVAKQLKIQNAKDPTYRYFASRGKARTQALREQLLHAQEKSRKAKGTFPDAAIYVRAMPSQQHVGLQLADYCLWSLQRLLTKGEDRFLALIWPKVGLIVDADDVSEKPYGTYHTRKRPVMNAEDIKKRKVED